MLLLHACNTKGGVYIQGVYIWTAKNTEQVSASMKIEWGHGTMLVDLTRDELD